MGKKKIAELEARIANLQAEVDATKEELQEATALEPWLETAGKYLDPYFTTVAGVDFETVREPLAQALRAYAADKAAKR